MTWAAGYHDTHEYRDDSGEATYAEALAWLLYELDQRAMALEADPGVDPAADADELDELRAAWRFFRGLPEGLGGEERAGNLVFWLACDEERPQSVGDMLRAAWMRRRRPVQADNLDRPRARVADLQRQAGAR